jgi:hypothetical protein
MLFQGLVSGIGDLAFLHMDAIGTRVLRCMEGAAGRKCAKPKGWGEGPVFVIRYKGPEG